MAEPVPIHQGLSSVADDYDGVIVDVWGVLHNGVQLFPGTRTVLDRLATAGKRVVMLTNAPRRSAVVARTLVAMGLQEDHCRYVLSSGEASHIDLRDRTDPFYRNVGVRYVHIGPGRDRSLFAGLDLKQTERLDDASLIVNTGPWEDEETVADYDDLLARGAELGLPMLCANPDLEVVRGNKVVICAGTLAARYEALGGSVRYLGKPRPEIYDYCFRILDGIDRSRILAIGDSLRTDIAGAGNVGIDSILVGTGIHARALGIADGHDLPGKAQLARLIDHWNIRPTALIPTFRW